MSSILGVSTQNQAKGHCRKYNDKLTCATPNADEKTASIRRQVERLVMQWV